MTYAIIGMGAIGGYYGGRLAQHGHNVHFLFHSDYETALERGLTVFSANGNFRLPRIHAYSDTRLMPAADVVIVALKSTKNKRLLPDLLPRFLRNDPIVLFIQNGIGIEPDVQVLFPQAQLAAGMAFICAAKSAPATIHHTCYGSINISNYSVRNIRRLRRIISDFQESGIDAHEVEYREARWKKAVWNMPFNGMSVALNADTSELLGNPFSRRLIRDQMQEVIDAACALGVRGLGPSFADKMILNTLRMKPYKPSMKLDYDNFRPMEIEYLYSRPLAMARAVGFPMPRLEMLEAELRFMEKSRIRRNEYEKSLNDTFSTSYYDSYWGELPQRPRHGWEDEM